MKLEVGDAENTITPSAEMRWVGRVTSTFGRGDTVTVCLARTSLVPYIRICCGVQWRRSYGSTRLQ